eukprot:COSAG02_NODE_58746_length_276_cov_0.875706_1_plen_21_part_10
MQTNDTNIIPTPNRENLDPTD